MEETNNAVSTAQLANRRGFLLGITLAEILLITLFVLLLLFRHYQDKAGIADDVIAVLGKGPTERLIAASKNLPPSNVAMSGALADITQTLIDCRKLESSECLDLSQVEPIDDTLAPEVAEQLPKPSTLEDAKNEIEDLAGQLAVAMEELRRRQRKTGEKPFCTYREARESSLKLRGSNISVGTFLIEEDGITLIARDSDFQQNMFVDFNGEPYDGTEAVKEISNWPINQKLSFDAFAELGKIFVDLGNREAEKRVSCRFGADYYYVPSDATDRARERVLEEYFFLGGNRLDRKDYLSRRQR